MKYWLFNCNPRMWEIDEFLESGCVFSTWKINAGHKEKVCKGDKGFIRVGHDKRTKKQLNGRNKLERGIYAVVEIISNPEQIDDSGDQFWLLEEKKNEIIWRVRIKYSINLIDNPVLLSNIQNVNGIKKQTAIIKGQQTVTAEVPKSDFDIIIKNCQSNIEVCDSILNEEIIEIHDISRLETKYKDAIPTIRERVSRQIERGEIANAIKKFYNYECLICKEIGLNPRGFLKRNNVPYIEAHHFFPVSNLSKGSLGIGNLMTLCANHHKEIHYGKILSNESTKDFFRISINGNEVKIKKKKIDNTV